MNRLNLKPGMILKYNGSSVARKVIDVLENSAVLSTDYNHESISGLYTNKVIEEDFDLPKEKWKPELGQGYYYMDEDLGVNKDFWEDDNIDLARYKIGNCYQTEEECEAAIERVKKVL